MQLTLHLMSVVYSVNSFERRRVLFIALVYVVVWRVVDVGSRTGYSVVSLVAVCRIAPAVCWAPGI